MTTARAVCDSDQAVGVGLERTGAAGVYVRQHHRASGAPLGEVHDHLGQVVHHHARNGPVDVTPAHGQRVYQFDHDKTRPSAIPIRFSAAAFQRSQAAGVYALDRLPRLPGSSRPEVDDHDAGSCIIWPAALKLILDQSTARAAWSARTNPSAFSAMDFAPLLRRPASSSLSGRPGNRLNGAIEFNEDSAGLHC